MESAMPNELTQPYQPLSLDASIATLLYLLHTQALGSTELPNPRSAANIDQLLRALVNHPELGPLLRETCDDLSDSWTHIVHCASRQAVGSL
jgi:hypothetical protein